MYWCNKCGAVVSIGGKRDIVPCHKCGSEDYTASPQNLPKADAYSLLAEVRADVEQMYNLFINMVSEKEYPEHYKAFIYYYKKIKKVSEHFS